MKIVAVAGPIGAGKTTVAGIVARLLYGPALHWADPLYAGLSAMLQVSENVLRSQDTKEEPLAPLGVTPRKLSATLGQDWARDMIDPDFLVKLMEAKIEKFRKAGANVVAICGTRYPNEIAFVRSKGGAVWWVQKTGLAEPAAPSGDGGQCEGRISRDDCDLVLFNDGIDRVRLEAGVVNALRISFDRS